ncbi:hypothetical protein [Paracoccus sulfuroxidans]|uniref:Uncharacterized protein n=1 Tax=Paracoccus sulfuroxidans TaxID=384678 RepID=A0A562NKT5_9RHOB|nr:hypothetical protein [Paracoccus sulfuroxidans]TWI32733.1 hypothetical protein IQ24_02608 [Paracoccus sulfuroxidans]
MAEKTVEIVIVTDRQPWVNDAPAEAGEILNASEADAARLIELGFAKPVTKKG